MYKFKGGKTRALGRYWIDCVGIKAFTGNVICGDVEIVILVPVNSKGKVSKRGDIQIPVADIPDLAEYLLSTVKMPTKAENECIKKHMAAIKMIYMLNNK